MYCSDQHSLSAFVVPKLGVVSTAGHLYHACLMPSISLGAARFHSVHCTLSHRSNLQERVTYLHLVIAALRAQEWLATISEAPYGCIGLWQEQVELCFVVVTGGRRFGQLA